MKLANQIITALKIRSLYSIIFILLLFVACDTEQLEITGNGNLAFQSFDLEEFHSIEQNADFPILLKQGVQEVKLEGDSNMLDQVVLEVENGRLIVSFKNEAVYRDFNMSLKVSLPDLEELQVNSAGTAVFVSQFDLSRLLISSTYIGKISTVDTLMAHKLVLDGFAVSEFEMAVAVDKLEIRGRDASFISIEGTAGEVLLNLEDVAVFEGFDLQAERMDLFQESKIAAEVFVKDYLKVKIESTGDVYCKGNPELDLEKSGAGELHKLECWN